MRTNYNPARAAAIKELASQTGLSPTSIYNYCRRLGNDCPELDDVDGWNQIVATAGRVGNGSAKGDAKTGVGHKLKHAVARSRARLVEAQAKKIERTNAEAEGSLVEVDSVKKIYGSVVGYFFAQLSRLERELPRLLSGLDKVAVAKEVEKQIELIRSGIKAELHIEKRRE